MKLYFENSYGDRREIADCQNLEEVYRAINNFITEANKKKPKGTKPFKSYYMRTWEEEGMTKFDVGSHTEFFLWER